MTSHPDGPAPRPVPWLWIATLLAIVLFFLLLVVGALHVQRTAERTLAQHDRELSEMAQRSLEVQLETELLLHEQERRGGLRSGHAPAERSPTLVLLGPSSPAQTGAYGAVSWDATTRRGVLLVAGLPALADPHVYELRIGDQVVPGVHFTCPEGGAVSHRWEAPAALAPMDSGAVELVCRRRPPGQDWIETIVLRAR